MGNKRMIKCLKYACCVGFAYILAHPFASNLFIHLIMVVATAPLVIKLLQKYQNHKQMKLKRRHYLTLLQCFAGELSAGGTYHIALVKTTEILQKQMKSDQAIYCALEEGIMSLKRQERLSDTMITIGQRIDLPESRSLFSTLAQNLELGNQTVHIVRDARDMYAKQLEIEEETKTEQAATITEAVCLMVVPFVMAKLFNNMFTGITEETGFTGFTITTVILVSAYCIACLAMFLGCKMLFPVSAFTFYNRPRKKSQNFWIEKLATTSGIQYLARRLQSFLTPHYLSEWNQMIEKSCSTPRRIKDEIALRLTVILIFEVVVLLATIGGGLPLWMPAVTPLLTWLFLDQQLRQQFKHRELTVNAEMPLLLETFLQFLRAGEVTEAALKRTLTSQKEFVTTLHLMIREALKNVQTGSSLDYELNKLARRFSTVQIQSVFILIAQFHQTGHSDTLDSLNEQKYACWQLYKKVIQEKGKNLATRLLLPMSLDLLSVMLIAITPAVNIFTAF